jgi:hypothetical protein
MAVLKGSVIGQLSGRLGDLTARIIRGRTILAQRPTSFHVNNSPTMVEIRKKFAVSVSFVTNMLTLAAIHEIWDKAKASGMTVYNYGVRQNFPLSSADKPTVDNLLSPNDGFPLDVTLAEVAADAVTATIAALDTVMIPTEEERDLTPNLMLCYYNPVNPDDAPYAVVPVQGATQVLDTVNPIALNIPLNIVQQQIAAKYQNSTLYIALTTHDADGKVVQYSATFAQDN